MSELVNSEKIFTGKYPGKLDDKNRLTIPVRWRFESHGDTPFPYLAVFNPYEGCIMIFPSSLAEAFHKASSAVPFHQTEKRRLFRKFFGESRDVSCDGAGRIMLDPDMCKKANITKDVFFVGESNAFSINAAEPPAPDETSDEALIYTTALGLLQPEQQKGGTQP
ncbi:MAG: hypothetical protein LBT53_02600 [Puniceicoccales bacterium]|jgi:MraZ protein|nr:hypothetical protein [Puniceicoccales bacterium]